MDELLDASIGRRGSRRLLSSAAALFGIISMALLGTGLYALFADVIDRKQQEIGLRIALGADSWAIGRLLGREIGSLLALGALLGLGTSAAVAKVIQSRLMVESTDATAWALALVLLLLTAALAAVAPLRTALRSSPAEILRRY
ncbi:MAG TPA: FtsX-like permease family protein [Vicinamibacterales bacterium]